MFRFLFLLLISSSAKSQTVYKTPSGNRYHNAVCSSVRNVSEAMTVEEAYKIGLTPCLICKPAKIYANPLLKKKAQGQDATSQCIGQTKAGKRCRHMTSIGNGYCYQHQPG